MPNATSPYAVLPPPSVVSQAPPQRAAYSPVGAPPAASLTRPPTVAQPVPTSVILPLALQQAALINPIHNQIPPSTPTNPSLAFINGTDSFTSQQALSPTTSPASPTPNHATPSSTATPPTPFHPLPYALRATATATALSIPMGAALSYVFFKQPQWGMNTLLAGIFGSIAGIQAFFNARLANHHAATAPPAPALPPPAPTPNPTTPMALSAG